MALAEINPFLLVALALALALIALVGRRTARAQLARAAAAAAALAFLCALLAWLVVTPAEQVMNHTRQLLHLTAPLDRPALTSLLSNRAALQGPDGEDWVPAGDLLDELDLALNRWQVLWHRVNHVRVESIRGDQAVVDLDLRTWLDSQYGSRPFATRWRLHWVRESNRQWRLQSIQWLELSGDPPVRGIWK